MVTIKIVDTQEKTIRTATGDKVEVEDFATSDQVLMEMVKLINTGWRRVSVVGSVTTLEKVVTRRRAAMYKGV